MFRKLAQRIAPLLRSFLRVNNTNPVASMPTAPVNPATPAPSVPAPSVPDKPKKQIYRPRPRPVNISEIKKKFNKLANIEKKYHTLALVRDYFNESKNFTRRQHAARLTFLKVELEKFNGAEKIPAIDNLIKSIQKHIDEFTPFASKESGNKLASSSANSRMPLSPSSKIEKKFKPLANHAKHYHTFRLVENYLEESKRTSFTKEQHAAKLTFLKVELEKFNGVEKIPEVYPLISCIKKHIDEFPLFANKESGNKPATSSHMLFYGQKPIRNSGNNQKSIQHATSLNV